MDKDEALWVESKLGLDSNGEFNSIPFANMTHPSLDEALDKINPRATNPWEILDNKTSNESQDSWDEGMNLHDKVDLGVAQDSKEDKGQRCFVEDVTPLNKSFAKL